MAYQSRVLASAILTVFFTLACPPWHQAQPEQATLSFLGARIVQGGLECSYGVGFSTLTFPIENNLHACHFPVVRRRGLGDQAPRACLGSVEQCFLHCKSRAE
jgi:hypothetical protein